MKLFDKVGNTAKTTIRFSTVGGESGSPDTARDPRGFAIKVRTEEGNWDMGMFIIYLFRLPKFFSVACYGLLGRWFFCYGAFCSVSPSSILTHRN